MKKINLALLSMLVLLCLSCSSGTKVKLESSYIYNLDRSDSSDNPNSCVSIDSDVAYLKLQKENSSVQVVTTVKFVKPLLVSGEYEILDCRFDAKDNDGNDLTDEDEDDIYLDCSDKHELDKYKDAIIGTTFSIEFSREFDSEKEAKEFLKQVKTFGISMQVKQTKKGDDDNIFSDESDDTENNADIESEDSTNTASADAGECLKEYGKLVDMYVKAIKDFNNGKIDILALTEIAQKASELQSKMEAMDGDFDLSQAKEYKKLTEKMQKLMEEAAAIDPEKALQKGLDGLSDMFK